MGKTSRDKRDIYYRLAKDQGYRARAAFKLLQLDAKLGILNDRDGRRPRVVDLCAAPGGWSQVAAESGCACVAVDLKEMAPIDGVKRVAGDITSDATVAAIEAADVVLCDGAPDVYGLADVDGSLQHRLVRAAFDVACRVLRPGGVFVSKIYRGRETKALFEALQLRFDDVVCAKPRCSRNASLEAYAVARGFGGSSSSSIIPFVACGLSEDDFDADASYPLDGSYAFKDPVQMPINPAHLAATLPYRHIPDDGATTSRRPDRSNLTALVARPSSQRRPPATDAASLQAWLQHYLRSVVEEP